MDLTVPVLAAIGLVPFPLLRWWSRRIERSRGSDVDRLHRLRVASMVVTFGVVVLAGVAGFALGHDDVIDTHPVLGLAGLVVALVMAALSAQAALRPSYERLRGIRGTTRRVRRRALRGLLVVVGLQLVWFALFFGLLALHVNGFVLIGVVVLWLLLTATVGPYVVMAAVPTRRADDTVRRQVADLAERAGVRTRDVRVIDTGHNPAANAMVSGFGPGPAYVFLTDRLLTELSEEELAAVVAHEIGHRKRHHIALKLATQLAVMVVVGGLLVALLLLTDDAVAKVAVVATPLVMIAALFAVRGIVGIRLEQSADDFAAGLTGADALARALERIAELNMMKRRTGRVWNVLTQHPGTERRLERLHAASERQPVA